VNIFKNSQTLQYK